MANAPAVIQEPHASIFGLPEEEVNSIFVTFIDLRNNFCFGEIVWSENLLDCFELHFFFKFSRFEIFFRVKIR